MNIDPRETLKAWMDRGGCGLSASATADVCDKAATTAGNLRGYFIEDLFHFSRIATREILNFAARQDDPELCADENLPKLKEWTRAELADIIHAAVEVERSNAPAGHDRIAGVEVLMALRDRATLTPRDMFEAMERADEKRAEASKE